MLIKGTEDLRIQKTMAAIKESFEALICEKDYNGKKVFAVMTHEGSGLGGSERTLKQSCKGATVGRGLAVHGADAARSEATVAAWAKTSV